MQVTPFNFDQYQVRTLRHDDGEVWFVAPDVCDALDVGNVSMAVGRLDDDEKGISSIDTLGGPQEVTIISESGLYSLVLTSRKPEAIGFIATNNRLWNPRTNDGDCARMEAALGINVEWSALGVVCGKRGFETTELFVNHAGDKQAARRMASLRMAAEHGKAKP